jgi:dihydrofolate reductase
MPFKIIVAKDEKGGIGKDNTLPWHFKEDLRRFAKLTRGNGNNAVLMGRNTWDSLPIHPLTGRHNLMLSNSAFLFSSVTSIHYDEKRISTFKDINIALEYIKENNYEDVWIIGGEKVYTAFLNDPKLNKLVQSVYVTEIAGDYGCDAFFGQLDEVQYHEMSCECVGEKMKFKVYHNKTFGN